jgi:hypothetical protein
VRQTPEKSEQIQNVRKFIEKMGKLAGLHEDEISMLFLAPTEDIPEIGHRWVEMQESAERTLDLTVAHWMEQYIASKKEKPSDDEISEAYERFDRARIQAMRHDLRQVLYDALANFKNNVFVTAQDRLEFSQPVSHDRLTLPIPFPPDDEIMLVLKQRRSKDQSLLPRPFPEEEQ